MNENIDLVKQTNLKENDMTYENNQDKKLTVLTISEKRGEYPGAIGDEEH